MIISDLNVFFMLHKVGNANCNASASIKRIYDLNVLCLCFMIDEKLKFEILIGHINSSNL